MRRTIIITTAALVLCVAPLLARAPVTQAHPTFAGTWQPADPARSDELFGVGLTRIPGSGRLTLEQRSDRLTVTITMPDDVLDPLLDLSGPFFQTVVYRLPESRLPPGGFGAAGPPPLRHPTWVGDRLVVPNAWPSARPTTTTLSLDGDRLRLDTRVEVSRSMANAVTQWFTRVK